MAKLCIQLGYLQDSNAAAHSVDSDIFYAILMIHLPARQDFFFFYFCTFLSRSRKILDVN